MSSTKKRRYSKHSVADVCNATGLSKVTVLTLIGNGLSCDDLMKHQSIDMLLEHFGLEDKDPGKPGSRSWSELPYSKDPWAQRAVAEAAENGGMGLDEIGALMGITRQRVQQIEVRALEKLRAAGGSELRVFLDAVRDREDRLSEL